MDADIATLVESAQKHAETDPIYSLLLCRKAAEGFLMKKHMEMVDEGEAKEVLTLGDAFSNKLGIRDSLNPLEIMSIQYIQNATNPFLHFRVEPLELSSDLVPRVLQEIQSLIGVEKSEDEGQGNRKSEPKLEDWRVTLQNELDHIDWPSTFGGTIFNPRYWQEQKNVEIKHMKGLEKHYESGKSNVNFDYNSMTVSELKEKLAKRGLKISGKKAELISRLVVEIGRTRMKKAHFEKLCQMRNVNIAEAEGMISLNDDQRRVMMREATEAGLIALYNSKSNKKYHKNSILSVKNCEAFLKGVESVVPKHGKGLKKRLRKWKFLFFGLNKKKSDWSVKLKHDWKFLEL